MSESASCSVDVIIQVYSESDFKTTQTKKKSLFKVAHTTGLCPDMDMRCRYLPSQSVTPGDDFNSPLQ